MGEKERQTHVVAEEDAAVVRAADARASAPAGGGSALRIELGEIVEALGTLHRPVADFVAAGVAFELLGSVSKLHGWSSKGGLW